jgi:sulfate adenylyltransferase subunit 2
VVEVEGLLMAVNEFFPLPDGMSAERMMVRYRTVGDATGTGAVRSQATEYGAVIEETAATRITERGATRGDDRFSEAAMEDRKKEGYF